jgi:hypothetical protein
LQFYAILVSSLFARPGIEFCSCIIEGIFLNFAANKTGTARYAPIPTAAFGRVSDIMARAENMLFTIFKGNKNILRDIFLGGA